MSERNEIREYIERGWHIVMLHGIRDADGECTCGSKHEGSRGSRGKHPIAAAWQDSATIDTKEIIRIAKRVPEHNIGLLLGPKSGIIDIEFDDPEGEKTARELFEGIKTPTYHSGRSVHRLFRWNDELPRATCIKWRGLEIRLGADKAQQSVAPPSIHHSGHAYRWAWGFEPWNVELMDVPEEVLIGIANQEAGGEDRPEGKGREILTIDRADEGGRNDVLFRFACRQFSSISMADPRAVGDVCEIVRAMNLAKCNPPLGDEEIETLINSAMGYALRDEHKNGSKQVSQSPQAVAGQSVKIGYERHGLERVPDNRDPMKTFGWKPGSWKLTVVDTDPVTYELIVPEWEGHVKNGQISLNLGQFENAARMASAVLAQTKMIILDEAPRMWPEAWNGRRGFPGLKSQLMEVAGRRSGDQDCDRLLCVAVYMDERLQTARDGSLADVAGSPVRLDDGQIVLQWTQFFQNGVICGRFTKADVADFKRRLGLTSDDSKQVRCNGGGRKYLTFLAAPHLQELSETLEQGYGGIDVDSPQVRHTVEPEGSEF